MNDTALAGVTAPPLLQSAELLTIRAAIERMRAHGHRDFAIEVEVWCFAGTRLEVTFKVWDGRKHYNQPTLEGALAEALRVTGTIENAQAFATEAAQLPEPATKPMTLAGDATVLATANALREAREAKL